ncbi:MAG TPA: carotenoid oxygenase family protein [Thermoanaerobaculia bacterium]
MMQSQENLPWRGVFRDLPREHGFEPLRVEGTLPEQLRGVLYRCGPARFGIGGEPYLHWFDADGAVAAVRFEGSRVDAAVRTVATRWLREERAANRQLYRSYAQLGRGWRRWLTLPKNPANISVMPYDGQVLALWEAGLPIALDPSTLEARGETDLGGRIGPTFSAHPHRVGKTLFNFGVKYGPKFSIDLYRFENGIARVANIPLPRPTIIHDFIATSKHIVFFCPPVRLRLARLLAGMGSFDSNLAWEPQHGTEVVVVPLADPDKPVRFTVPPFFQWHFVNAWEEGGTLVVDYLPYDDFETNAWFGRAPYEPARQPPPSRYARARLDLKSRRMDVDVLSEVSVDFPAIHPDAAGREHDQVWLLDFDRSIPPSLVRFDTGSRTMRRVPLGENTFPSEAIVTPEGWVLSLVYDGGRDASYVAVIDGARPEDGPVARLWFDHAIPFLFHGAWAR